jgi:DsbC/DsbD-like thiol-disulfide interchange protein
MFRGFSNRSLLVLLALVAGLASVAWAAIQAEPVRVTAPSQAVHLKPGHAVTVPLQIVALQGWHVFGTPPLVEGIQGAALTFAAQPGVTVTVGRWPAPHRVMLGALKKEGNVYEGTVKVPVTICADAHAAPGARLVEGTLKGQACSDQQCRFLKLSFKLPVEVGK